MNDPDLTRDAVEQLLDGRPAGPVELQELLTAASSGFTSEVIPGEEAAVAAFRTADHRRPESPNRRGIPVSAVLKAALAALALLLAGSIAMAATTGHFPAPSGDRPTRPTPAPATADTTRTRAEAPQHSGSLPDPLTPRLHPLSPSPTWPAHHEKKKVHRGKKVKGHARPHHPKKAASAAKPGSHKKSRRRDAANQHREVTEPPWPKTDLSAAYRLLSGNSRASTRGCAFGSGLPADLNPHLPKGQARGRRHVCSLFARTSRYRPPLAGTARQQN